MDMSWGLFVLFFNVIFVAIWWFWKIRHQQVNAVASIVTVIGVLGTFGGIAIGLFLFDTENIEASVPALLEGLKVAFGSSIVGIIGSIWLKWNALNRQRKQASSKKPQGATIDDLAETLKDIYEIQQSEGEETRETLRAIEKSLTGDGDSTVLTQLQKLRTTFSDKQEALIDAFKDFATQMAENNTQALIKALEEVMKDFNAKINEQFGDNFKQLNEAVGRINDWQEQYRQQMDELAEEFRIAADSIEKSRQSLEIIAERSDAIVSSAEKLNPILQTLQDQIEAFSALADNARNAFPIIEGRLNQLTDDFSKVVTKTIDDSHAFMNKQREALGDQSQQLKEMVENTSTRLQEMTDDFSKVVRETIDDSHDSMEDQREALQNFTGVIGDVIQNTSQELESIVEATNRQLRTETERVFRESADHITQLASQLATNLDSALETQLTKSIESLGSQLTSLSNQFVEDYRPLTNQLRNVVRIAEQLRR